MCSDLSYLEERPSKRQRGEEGERWVLSAANLLNSELMRTEKATSSRQRSISSCGQSSEQRSEMPCIESESSEGETSESDSDASSVDYEFEVFGSWKALQKLSSGNNGQVYLGKSLSNPEGGHVALKVEKRSPKHSHLKTELRVFEKLRDTPGFPKIFDQGKLSKTLWMAMELLETGFQRKRSCGWPFENHFPFSRTDFVSM
eukprot:EG_transcript_14628